MSILGGHWDAPICQDLGPCTDSSALEICLASTCSRSKMWQETEEAKASPGHQENGSSRVAAGAERWPCLPNLLSIIVKYSMSGLSLWEAVAHSAGGSSLRSKCDLWFQFLACISHPPVLLHGYLSICYLLFLGPQLKHMCSTQETKRGRSGVKASLGCIARKWKDAIGKTKTKDRTRLK